MDINVSLGWIAFLTPIVIGLTQALKGVPLIAPRKWLWPFLAVAVGLLLAAGSACLLTGPATFPEALFHGLLAGLAAASLWDGGKGLMSAYKGG